MDLHKTRTQGGKASIVSTGADCVLETMQTTESFKRVSQATADAYTTAAQASRSAAERCVNYTRRNPMKVLLGAVSVGVLVAWALHRRGDTWQDRTFTLPIKRMKNWASSAAERAGDVIHDYSDRATEMAGDAMHAVQKSARGLRFWS